MKKQYPFLDIAKMCGAIEIVLHHLYIRSSYYNLCILNNMAHIRLRFSVLYLDFLSFKDITVRLKIRKSQENKLLLYICKDRRR